MPSTLWPDATFTIEYLSRTSGSAPWRPRIVKRIGLAEARSYAAELAGEFDSKNVRVVLDPPSADLRRLPHSQSDVGRRILGFLMCAPEAMSYTPGQIADNVRLTYSAVSCILVDLLREGAVKYVGGYGKYGEIPLYTIAETLGSGS